MKKEEGIVQRKEVKAILFDLDGVLVDSLSAWHATFNNIRKKDGKEAIPTKLFRKNFGSPIERDIKLYFPEKTVYELNRLKDIYFSKNIHLVNLFSHSIHALKKVKGMSIKTGLISNSTGIIVKSIIKQFKLGRFFDVIITSQEVKRGKPAPDMIIKVCKLLRVNPKNTILIGDTMNDMVAGRRAGCITVGYKVNGDYRINKLISITRFLNQNLNRT